MKRFTHSNGTEFVFGASMESGMPVEMANCISWDDPKLGEWETKASNEAGNFLLSVDFQPQLIFEYEKLVVAYQPGLCVEIEYIGGPFVWATKILAAAFVVSNARAA